MRIKVNPSELKDKEGKPVKGSHLLCFDSAGRLIEYKEGGSEVTKNTHISRMIKCGDLVLCKESEMKKPIKKTSVTEGK